MTAVAQLLRVERVQTKGIADLVARSTMHPATYVSRLGQDSRKNERSTRSSHDPGRRVFLKHSDTSRSSAVGQYRVLEVGFGALPCIDYLVHPDPVSPDDSHTVKEALTTIARISQMNHGNDSISSSDERSVTLPAKRPKTPTTHSRKARKQAPHIHPYVVARPGQEASSD